MVPLSALSPSYILCLGYATEPLSAHTFYLSLAPLADFLQDGESFSKTRETVLSEVYPENVKAFPDIMGSLLIENTK